MPSQPPPELENIHQQTLWRDLSREYEDIVLNKPWQSEREGGGQSPPRLTTAEFAYVMDLFRAHIIPLT